MGIESLIIGGVAGWLAGIIIKGFGFGTLGNIISGIIGTFSVGSILPAIGAVILLFIIKLIKRA